MASCSSFTPSHFRAYSYCLIFFNIVRIYIGKKAPFFLIFSMPWEMSSSRNVPKSCSWPRGGWARAGALCPAPISAPSLPGLARWAVPPLGDPSVPWGAGPAQPCGSTSSGSATAGHSSSGGRREQKGGVSSLERDKLFVEPLLLQRLAVSCPLGCASGLFHFQLWTELQEMLEVPALWCVII